MVTENAPKISKVIFINAQSQNLIMEAVIVNFRGGKHTKYNNQMILKVEKIEKKEEAQKIIGKKVTWESSAGKKITGKISNIHGNSGAVKAIFEKGMPGQAISQKVKVE